MHRCCTFHVLHAILGYNERYLHDDPFIGVDYSNEEITAALDSCKLSYSKSQDICTDVAELLNNANIVGWFQGRNEFGPRALGNRSILADPTLPDMKDKINREVKHREAFRPFAPSIPTEFRDEYFDTTVNAPFMLKVCPVWESRRQDIPAIVHVDGSARLQTVERKTNPRYHELLCKFRNLSGHPVLLNTSFNVMGEPIVQTPIDAIRCFFSTGLDILIIGDYIIRK